MEDLLIEWPESDCPEVVIEHLKARRKEGLFSTVYKENVTGVFHVHEMKGETLGEIMCTHRVDDYSQFDNLRSNLVAKHARLGLYEN